MFCNIGCVLLVALLAFTGAEEEITASSSMSTHRIHRRSVNIGAKVGNRTLNIVTIVAPPYVMKNETATTGQPEYYGFVPELIYELSRRLRFQYRFYESPDGKYGNEDATGKWTGMLGECIKNVNDITQGADIAAAPIAITSTREKVVDFIKPFQHLGLTVLIKRPDTSNASVQYAQTFGIFQPLDPGVWGLVALLTVVVGLVLWLMNLYNPYEWGGRHAIGLAEEHQAEAFNLTGSMWFIFASLQWQGFQRSPRSIASRFLCGIWFTFVTIFLVTYTAGVVNNLIWASMIHKNSQNPSPTYTNLGDIMASKEYEIGAVDSGSTYFYIMNVAKGEEFAAIRAMWTAPGGQNSFVPTVIAGVTRVRSSKYALITESGIATYYMNQRPCDLQTVGDAFAKRSYGFAVPNNSLILDDLHTGILEMMEEGEIEALEEKWFVGTGQCWNATKRGVGSVAGSDAKNAPYVDQPRKIDLNMFWGAIVLLVVGIVVSLTIAAAEFVFYRQWGKYNSSNQPRDGELKMDPE